MFKDKWYLGALLLALSFLLAIWLVAPIGISTQFVVFDGILLKLFNQHLLENLDYFTIKASILESINNPLSYSLIFVVAMVLGGFIGRLVFKNSISAEDKVAPEVWRDVHGNNPWKRYGYVFLAGVIALFGARMANGCTSGNMMSGIMQTSIRGYLFAASAFCIAIPVAFLIYKKK